MSEKNTDNGIIELEKVKKNAKDRQLQARRAAKKLSSVKNENKKPVSLPILIVAVVLIFLVIYLIADFSSGGILSTVNGKFVSVLTSDSSQNFVVATDAENVYSFDSYSSGYVILTEKGITGIDSSGKEIFRQQLTYSNPSLEMKGNRILVFDRGNNSYSLFRNQSFYSQMKTESDIIDAVVSKRDNYAIAVRDDNAKSVLYGYDGSGKVIYQWNCPDGYIADVAMNSSGSKVAVTVIDAENAVLSSSVYILDFEYTTAYAQFDYKEEIVIGSVFLSDRKIQVVTDKNVYLVSGKEQKVVYPYGSADVCYTYISDGKCTAVITNDHSHDNYYTLSVFGTGGKLRFSVPLNGKVRDVSVSEKSIAVLFDNKTETYSKRGKLVGATQDINYNDEIVINSNFLFVLSSESVRRFSSYGTSSAVYAFEDETF